MAKKVVATLKTGSGKEFAKVYRAVKNKKDRTLLNQKSYLTIA
jgi:hypothetical protein